MAEKDPPEKALWMFRGKAAAPETGTVDFDPVDAIYHLRKNTRNPYLKRAIAPAAAKTERSPADLTRLLGVMTGPAEYRAGPANRHEPFSRRSLHHPAPPPAAKKGYQEPEKLAGDIFKLPWLINEFFQSVLLRLRRDPWNFEAVVNELLAMFRENNVNIRLYEAYYSFRDWEQLMETLEEIGQYPAPETFDLFCSALLTYYELVYPPEGG